jgi:flagellar assembly protein FliH
MMDSAIHIKPFGFDRVFRFAGVEAPTAGDGGEIAAEAQARELQAQIVRILEEHQVELAQARADGFEAGLWQARHDRDAALLAAVDALHGALDDVDMRLTESEQAVSRDAAQVAVSAAEALAGHALALDPLFAIDAALGRVLRQVRRGTQLGIRIHPSLAADIGRRIADRQALDRRKLSIAVLPDDNLTPGDAHIVWEEGGLIVDGAARRAAVLAELDPLLAPPVAPHPDGEADA